MLFFCQFYRLSPKVVNLSESSEVVELRFWPNSLTSENLLLTITLYWKIDELCLFDNGKGTVNTWWIQFENVISYFWLFIPFIQLCFFGKDSYMFYSHQLIFVLHLSDLFSLFRKGRAWFLLPITGPEGTLSLVSDQLTIQIFLELTNPWLSSLHLLTHYFWTGILTVL